MIKIKNKKRIEKIGIMSNPPVQNIIFLKNVKEDVKSGLLKGIHVKSTKTLEK